MVDPVRLEVENEYLKEQNEELKRQLTDANNHLPRKGAKHENAWHYCRIQPFS